MKVLRRFLTLFKHWHEFEIQNNGCLGYFVHCKCYPKNYKLKNNWVYVADYLQAKQTKKINNLLEQCRRKKYIETGKILSNDKLF